MRILLMLSVFVACAVLLDGPAWAARVFGQSNVFSVSVVTAVDDGGGVPEATAITGIYPNPFNPRVTIEFALAEPGRVELSIYDLMGRRVRTLDDDSRGIGRYRVVWNGCDDAGRELPASTYQCLLVTPGGRRSMRVTLAK